MSTTLLSLEARRVGWLGLAADCLELTKPKIAALVLVTVAVAATVADWGVPQGWLLANTLLGTALVAASASALNQLLERESDARMPRTADRPLPAGRVTPRQVAIGSAVAIVVGTIWLAWAVNPRTAALGVLTWALYVWVYTPLKSRTTQNTTVGAVAGALPVLMGWTAVGAPLNLQGWALFLIVYLWQFPHFMAIAWIYRRQYADAGLKMLSVVDPSGYRPAALAIVSALCLIPVSLVPALSRPAAELYFAWAILLGAGQLAMAVWFFFDLSEAAARRLLLASLIYLPVILALLVLAPLA